MKIKMQELKLREELGRPFAPELTVRSGVK